MEDQSKKNTRPTVVKIYKSLGITGGFTSIPNTLIKYQARLGLNSNQLAIVLNILRCWWGDPDNLPFISQESIADSMGISLRTVEREISKLKLLGLVVTEHATSYGKANRYDLRPMLQRVADLEKKEGAGVTKTVDPALAAPEAPIVQPEPAVAASYPPPTFTPEWDLESEIRRIGRVEQAKRVAKLQADADAKFAAELNERLKNPNPYPFVPPPPVEEVPLTPEEMRQIEAEMKADEEARRPAHEAYLEAWNDLQRRGLTIKRKQEEEKEAEQRAFQEPFVDPRTSDPNDWRSQARIHLTKAA